jgi:hypothetical protein
MTTTLETAYRRLRTRYVRFRIEDGPWTTTHFHEIDQEGDWTLSNPDNDLDCILVVDPKTPARIQDDRISFQAYVDLEEKTVELQFLEHRPRKNLRERILL